MIGWSRLCRHALTGVERKQFLRSGYALHRIAAEADQEIERHRLAVSRGKLIA
jgi:hypothetical protein